jgi:hypothetical protein
MRSTPSAPFNRDFDKHFKQTEKTIKGLSCIALIWTLVQAVFILAIMAGIVYFIAYAVTHWLRW